MSLTPPPAAYPPAGNPQHAHPSAASQVHVDGTLPVQPPGPPLAPPAPTLTREAAVETVSARPAVAAAPWPVYTFHRFLGAFPVVFFVSALVTDIVYALTAEMMWANFSSWMLVVGVVFGAVALVLAIIEGIRRRRRWPRGSIWRLRVGRSLILGLSIVNVLVHSRDGYTSVVPLGLLLSAVVAVLVLATCWLDARLSNRLFMGVLR